jgi:hypothetical protein
VILKLAIPPLLAAFVEFEQPFAKIFNNLSQERNAAEQ